MAVDIEAFQMRVPLCPLIVLIQAIAETESERLDMCVCCNAFVKESQGFLITPTRTKLPLGILHTQSRKRGGLLISHMSMNIERREKGSLSACV